MLRRLLILLMGILVAPGNANGKIRVPIGAVFLKDHEDTEHAARYALQRFQSPMFQAELVAETIDRVDHVELSAIVCQLLHRGVVALAAPPGSPEVHRALVSYSNTFHVPLVSSQPMSPGSESSYGVSVRPRTLEAAASLVKHYGWPSFLYLYDSDDGLRNLQELTQDEDVASRRYTQMKVSDVAQAAEQLSKLGLADPDSVRYVVLDTSQALAHSIINKQIKETTSFGNIQSHFVLLRPVTDDFWHFRRQGFGSVNVTALRLVDPDFPPAREFHKVMRTWKTSHHHGATPVDAYLHHDAMIAFLTAFKNLVEENPTIFEDSLVGDQIYFNGSQGIECHRRPPQVFEKGQEISRSLRGLKTADGLTGHLQFDKNGERTGVSLELIATSPRGRQKIGHWSDKNGLTIVREPLALAQLSSDGSKTGEGLDPAKKFVIASVLSRPYLMLKKGADDEYEGYIPDLIQELSNAINFEYKIRVSKDGSYGRIDTNGSWNGLIAELIEKEADAVAADLTITSKRMGAVDFSLPFMVDSLGVLSSRTRSSRQLPSSYFFFRVFSRELWVAIVCVLVAFSVLSFLLNRLTGGPDRVHPRAEYHQSTLCGSFWFSTGTFFLQSTGTYPKSLSSRILACFWWFFVLLVIVIYVSQMTTLLLNHYLRLRPESFGPRELLEEASSGLRDVSVLRGGSTQVFFMRTEEPVLRELHPHLTFASTTSEGVERVKDGGDHSFIGASSVLKSAITSSCELEHHTLVVDYARYGLAFTKGSPYRSVFNRGLQKLYESGVLRHLQRKWLEGDAECTNVGPTLSAHWNAIALTLRNVSGVFCIVLAGFALALFIGGVEFCVSAQKEARKTKTPVQKVMWSKAQSSLRSKNNKGHYPVNDEEHSLQQTTAQE